MILEILEMSQEIQDFFPLDWKELQMDDLQKELILLIQPAALALLFLVSVTMARWLTSDWLV